MTLRVVIADDMPLARQELRCLLEEEPDVRIVRECGDGRETVRAVREERPDLLFLDVQMPEMDGFEVLCELDPAEIPATVFVTAYDHYAVKAFDVRALDYLLKPLDPARFHDTLERVRRQLAAASRKDEAAVLSDLLRELTEARMGYQRLAVPTGDRYLFLAAENILCLEAKENYVLIHTAAGRHLMRETMAHIEKRLDPARFLRVHRSWIVNVFHARELIPGPQRTYVLVLTNGQRVRVSRSYSRSVEALAGRKP